MAPVVHKRRNDLLCLSELLDLANVVGDGNFEELDISSENTNVVPHGGYVVPQNADILSHCGELWSK